jgi:hypothetical protein
MVNHHEKVTYETGQGDIINGIQLVTEMLVG